MCDIITRELDTNSWVLPLALLLLLLIMMMMVNSR
jgi:hypothetical protein